ncbi:MAG: L-glutamate gamma-semialdehyde dehydrogenase, partial [Planctomycetota bacterium]
MFNGIFRIPQPRNEPCLQYEPGSSERGQIKIKLQEILSEEYEVPMIIGGKEVRNGNLADIRCPHDHRHLLGRYHQADESYVTQAVDAAQEMKKEWGQMPWES